MSNATEPAWVGWHRPSEGAWREVCRCATEREAWDRLLDIAVSGDKTVLPRGRRPEDKPRQRNLF
jgi:hypothetical protein